MCILERICHRPFRTKVSQKRPTALVSMASPVSTQPSRQPFLIIRYTSACVYGVHRSAGRLPVVSAGSTWRQHFHFHIRPARHTHQRKHRQKLLTSFFVPNRRSLNAGLNEAYIRYLELSPLEKCRAQRSAAVMTTLTMLPVTGRAALKSSHGDDTAGSCYCRDGP